MVFIFMSQACVPTEGSDFTVNAWWYLPVRTWNRFRCHAIYHI